MAGLRAVAAVIAGVLGSMVAVGLIESAGHALFPVVVPSEATPEAMAAWAAQLPVGVLASVLLAWAVGSAVGILIAQSLWPTGRRAAAFWVGALMLAAVIANLVMIPPPLWFAAVGLAEVLLITWWLARRGVQSRQQVSA